jgi:hypothetical protein
MTQEITIKNYQDRVQAALDKVKDLPALREENEMVDFILRVGQVLFEDELDAKSVGWLIRHGGRLSGAYASLGNYANSARAERDVYEQKRDELKNEMTVEFYKESEKITHAKAQAEAELSEIDDLIVAKNTEKNDMDHIMKATERMISFIQTAASIKKSEHYRGELHDN